MKRAPSLNIADFGLARVTERDPAFGKVTFETGKSVTFTCTRNTEKAGYFGSTFGQDIEPTGIYMLHKEDDLGKTTGWKDGTMTFRNPLVLEALLGGNGGVYGSGGWKARLTQATGAKKRALSALLMKLGYDGIVTVGTMGGMRASGEIVALR